MSTSLRLIVCVCVSFVAASLFALASEKGHPPQAEALELATLMQAKLASSQKITEGLVTKDFDLIRKGAEEWRRIASATKWYSHADSTFAEHRAEFNRQADKLVRLSEEKNLDAAAYAYMGALHTCIGCHEYCRDVLHLPSVRKNPKAVSPIPDTDEDPTAPAHSGGAQ
jgi:hypothetical protein